MSRTKLSETIPTIMNLSGGEYCVLVNSTSAQLSLKTAFKKEELGELIEKLKEAYNEMK